MNDSTFDPAIGGGPPRVLYEKRGPVAYVTLNRPEVLNAMDTHMHEDLRKIWDDFEQDDQLWLAVLAGAGTQAFSVGQDLKELTSRMRRRLPPSSFGSHGGPGWPRLTERFSLVKPVIASVSGYALGGGFELALACDVIIAAENATFALPEARLGLIAGAGGLFRLTRQTPFKVAMGHLITGRSMSAHRAYELGLVNEVVPLDHLTITVDGWVKDILRCAPLSVRAVKKVALESNHLPLNQAFSVRYEAEELRRYSLDAIEGPTAFVEKRDPNWRCR
ncbi:enoyl-CoA hydratase/isomerase family protein (plasmid) [Burkholderia gladioli]|uniref:enoyl-CoA-hydratase DpgD n=1 Tax=Burkholderia gladioli TaxID=28095 RepID=UPI001938E4DA|nr:enoyl-CoA-hydratase DpgD [Burkholderia gladioli]QPQ89143.1 enoyl-CoA hydratase/isomerase family protein [Burkholderia gladioli]